MGTVFVRRASLSHTRVRDVREIAGLSSRSSHQAGFLQFQRGLSGAYIQGSHRVWVLRGERDGVSCVEKGEIAILITFARSFFFLTKFEGCCIEEIVVSFLRKFLYLFNLIFGIGKLRNELYKFAIRR